MASIQMYRFSSWHDSYLSKSQAVKIIKKLDTELKLAADIFTAFIEDFGVNSGVWSLGEAVTKKDSLLV